MHGRRDVPFWLLGLGALALGLLAWTPLPPGIWHDDGVYLMLGRSLARGEGLRYLGVPGAPLAPKFPPLYPAVTALAWWGGGDPLAAARNAALLNVAFTATAIALTAAFGARALRIPAGLALAAGAVAALSVDLWRPALVALSEPLYVLSLVAALWAAARAERDGAGRRELIVLVLALAVLVHVRTAGVAVVGAAVLGLAVRGHAGRAVTVGGAVGALMLPWALWSAKAGDALPEPLRDILGPYGAWLGGQLAGAPRAFAATLPGAAGALLRRTLELLVPAAPAPLWWVAAPPLGAAILLGGWRLARRSPTAALTLPLSLAIAWIWPFQDRRLLVPLLPVLLLALACAAEALLVRARDRSGSRIGARLAVAGLALLASWAAGFGTVSATRLAGGWAAAGYEIRARQLSDALAAMRGRVPPGAVVGAPELWPALHLITGVRVSPSARFRPVSPEGRPVWGSPAEQFLLWSAAGIDHLLLEQGPAVHGGALDALEAACPGVVRVLDVRPGQILVRLDWDARCRRAVGAES